MIDDLLYDIIKCYDLKECKYTITQLTGGITNFVYKINSVDCSYIVKILNNKNIKDIEKAEQICELAVKNGVNAIKAIKVNNRYVQKINNYDILLYEYYDGKVLLTKDLTLKHIKTLAHQLSILHKIECNEIYNEKYSKNDYNELYEIIKNKDEECFRFFKKNYKLLNKIYDKVYSSYLMLSNQTSYIHRDFNRKNVLWKEIDDFKIIDWETAKVGNPIIDFFNSAWFLTNDFQKDKFIIFKNTYFKNMNLIDDFEIGAYASIIEECNWLYFSLKRALGIDINNNNEIILGKNSIEKSLTEIFNFYNSIPKMLDLLKNS